MDHILRRPAVVFVDGLNGFGAFPGCVNSAIAGEFVRGGSLRCRPAVFFVPAVVSVHGMIKFGVDPP